FVFDFLNPPSAGVVKGAAGHLVLASVSDFPALVGNGIAVLVGSLGPCGMNTPHTHPRAAEFLYQVNGSIQSGMLTETGSRFILNNVTAGKGMILPQGSVHFQFNDNCEPVQFVSALNSDDPGTLLAAQGLFGLPPAIVAASLGEIGVEEVAGLAHLIPDDVAFGSQECLTRCGINAGTQPTAEQVPRVSGNALPTGSSSWSTSAKATETSTNFSRSTSLFGAVVDAAASSTSDKSVQPATIALGAIVGVMALGYVGLAAMYFMRRQQTKKTRSYVRPDMRGHERIPSAEKFNEASEPYDPLAASSAGFRVDLQNA
ncbi:RmlC-like cupin, partial [Wolfiporia cocos MD-104 SS10]